MACIVAYAQQIAPPIYWQKCIGGTMADAGNALTRTKDGGYVIAGSSKSNDGDFKDNRSKEDYAIIKTDSIGNVLWTRNYGGDNSDIATAVRVAKGGGYIVAGYSNSLGGDVIGNNNSTSDATDYWLVKLTETGLLEWQHAYGGSSYEYAYDIDNTNDGGYIVVGMSSSSDLDVVGDHGNGDCWIVKVDKNGLIQWQRSMGGNNPDVGRSVKATADGGYIVAGFSFSANGDVLRNNRSGNMWIIKLDADGKERWQKSLGGSLPDYAYDIEPVSDGGYIITGSAYSNDDDISGNHGGSDCVVVKISSNGDTEWLSCVGGSQDDVGQSVRETSDGSFIVAGFTKSNDGNVDGEHGDLDGWVIKLNRQGVMEWQKPLGGTKSDQANAVVANGDGSIVVAGMAKSNNGDVAGNHSDDADIWLVKINCLPVMPTIQLSVSKNPVCAGYDASFTTTITHAGNQPVYQWMQNGRPVGSNTATYSSNSLKQNDELYCVLTSNEPCAIQPTVRSNTIRMQIVAVDPGTQPAVTIAADKNNVCEGVEVKFTATVMRGDTIPIFRWKLNDQLLPDTGSLFITKSLHQNDVVKAELFVNNGCAVSVSSNAVSVNIQPAAKVLCMNDSSVTAGSVVQLKATVSGTTSNYAWFANGSLVSNLQSPVVTVTNTTSYQLKVTSTNDCVSTDEVVINVLNKLNIPNAFSPNNDGINDVWLITGLDPKSRIQVFDRFGKSVAEFSHANISWDGTYQGKPLPVGVYYYFITNPANPSYKGSLTILR